VSERSVEVLAPTPRSVTRALVWVWVRPVTPSTVVDWSEPRPSATPVPWSPAMSPTDRLWVSAPPSWTRPLASVVWVDTVREPVAVS